MSDTLKFSIPGKPQYLQVVRMAIGAVAAQANYDLDKIEDIKLAVEEACKLIACHDSEGFSEIFEIEVALDEKEMEIIVSDFCSCRKLDKDHRHFCARCPEEGNLGKFVIESLMDNYDIEVREDGNKKIKMVKSK